VLVQIFYVATNDQHDVELIGLHNLPIEKVTTNMSAVENTWWYRCFGLKFIFPFIMVFLSILSLTDNDRVGHVRKNICDCNHGMAPCCWRVGVLED
jgi:hypothetical protein